MTESTLKELATEVVVKSRESGISSVLFRHAVGERLNLNVTDMECLGLLFFKGLSTPSELAVYTGLSSGATTAMLDRLEKSGLVKRTPNPDDRRGVRITIIEGAAKKLAPMFASVNQAQDALMDHYTKAELELLADFFTRSTQMWDEERNKLLK